MKVRVLVRLKSGILDPQGATVQRALAGLGFDDVLGLRVGKLIEVDVEAPTEAQARARVDEMCRRLLANPLLEDYTVETERATTPDRADARLAARRGGG
jgi:phosphoribosylformylglycinamidine synthase